MVCPDGLGWRIGADWKADLWQPSLGVLQSLKPLQEPQTDSACCVVIPAQPRRDAQAMLDANTLKGPWNKPLFRRTGLFKVLCWTFQRRNFLVSLMPFLSETIRRSPVCFALVENWVCNLGTANQEMFQEVLTEPLHSTGDMYHNEEKLFSALGLAFALAGKDQFSQKDGFPLRQNLHWNYPALS